MFGMKCRTDRVQQDLTYIDPKELIKKLTGISCELCKSEDLLVRQESVGPYKFCIRTKCVDCGTITTSVEWIGDPFYYSNEEERDRILHRSTDPKEVYYQDL